IGDAAEFALHREALPLLRNARIDDETIEVGPHAEDVLTGGDERPRAGASEPGVFAFTRRGRELRGGHLGVDIGFRTIDVVVLLRRRADAEIVLERFFALAKQRPPDVDPRVVVGEDPRVFLVARRVTRDFAELE